MTPQQIEGAKERAEQVVNGFARVREQQARDVLALVAQVQHYERVIANLSEKAKSNDLFESMFGSRK